MPNLILQLQYCNCYLNICGQRIYRKAFPNILYQYLSFLAIFFSIDFAWWKCVELPRIV